MLDREKNQTLILIHWSEGGSQVLPLLNSFPWLYLRISSLFHHTNWMERAKGIPILGCGLLLWNKTVLLQILTSHLMVHWFLTLCRTQLILLQAHVSELCPKCPFVQLLWTRWNSNSYCITWLLLTLCAQPAKGRLPCFELCLCPELQNSKRMH